MKPTTTFLLAVLAMACNDHDQDPAPNPFKATEFYVYMDEYHFHTRTHRTKTGYDNDLNNYYALGPLTVATCTDTAIYNKISISFVSWKDPNQFNYEIQFYFAKSVQKSQMNKDSEYEFMDKLFGDHSFDFLKSSRYSPNEMAEIFNSKSSLVEVRLIDEHYKVWSTCTWSQDGSQFTVSDYLLEPYRGPEPNTYDYDFILTGTFNCKLYSEDDPGKFIDIKEGIFKVPILNFRYVTFKDC